MEALSEIVSTVDRLQDEVASLLGMLAQYCFMNEGKDIQRTFEKLLNLVKSKMDNIWPTDKSEQPLRDPPFIAVSNKDTWLGTEDYSSLKIDLQI